MSRADYLSHLNYITMEDTITNENLDRLLEYDLSEDQGLNVLKMAIVFNRVDIVESLLNHHININEAKLAYNHDRDGSSALHIAVEMGNATIIKLLLEHGADIDSKHCYSGNTPLHLSIREFDVSIVKLLLEAGANQRIKNDEQDVPLHVAVNRDSEEMVDILLRYSPDLEARDYYGFTPLHAAIMRKNVNIIRTLLARGASANTECNEHYFALTTAVVKCHPDIVHLLLDYGADACYVNETRLKYTALTWFCYCEGTDLCEIVESLISSIVMSYHIDHKVKLSPGFKMNQDLIQSMPKLYEFNTRCEEEIRKMNGLMAGYKITVFDVMKFGKNKDYNSLARCTGSLLKVLKYNKFNIYGRLIFKYINAGIYRKKVLKLATKKLAKEIGFLPHEIIYTIAEKLDSETLHAM